MIVRWSGERQVHLNLSLTLVDVKLVVINFNVHNSLNMCLLYFLVTKATVAVDGGTCVN